MRDYLKFRLVDKNNNDRTYTYATNAKQQDVEEAIKEVANILLEKQRIVPDEEMIIKLLIQKGFQIICLDCGCIEIEF